MDSFWINGGILVWPYVAVMLYIAYYAFSQDRKAQKEKELRKARKRTKH